MSADVHGRRDLGKNILTNWAAQLVQIVAGFIVPRLIDRQLSQEALGVWDLAWSIVVYFNIVQVGVTTSINRYVAFHRAQSDFDGINRVESSVAMVMRAMGGVVCLLSLGMAWQVGSIFSERLGAYVTEARWLVFFLGTGVAVQVSSAVFASVLTGCHRWDWHNGIQSATNVLMLLGMVAALLLGFGLIGLAVVHFAAETLGRSARVVVAYRICPWLQVRWRHFRWATAREMLAFGGKTFVTNISQMLLNSTVGVIVAAHLGPASLALYSRPLSLVRNLAVFVNKYAMVFSPTISSFQGAGRHEEVRELTIKATRYGLYLLLPILVFLVVFGGEVLKIWMGSRYADPLLIGILVSGFAMQLAYIPLFKALVGVNCHGQPGVVNLVAAGVAILAAYLSLAATKTGLVGVALSVGVPLTLVNGLYLPLYACRRLEIPVGCFFREVWRGPMLCALPFGAVLGLCRIGFGPASLTAAVLGAGAGGGILAILYWRSVLPARLKEKVLVMTARLGRWGVRRQT